MTRDLLAMRDWLLAERIAVVGMEATGAYWKPVFYLLEHDMECWLLNARHMKAVPGRKTDVKDGCGSPNSLSTVWCGPASALLGSDDCGRHQRRPYGATGVRRKPATGP